MLLGMRESIRQTDCTGSAPLSELAEILAAGLLRLRTRKSSPNLLSETDSPLDCDRVSGRDETSNFEGS
jgi:hypothetical protein